MSSAIKVNTKLELFDYLAMVNEIALEFFSDGGVYQPHIGKINAMRLFYNQCVVQSKFDEKYNHDIVDAMDMVDIVSDDEFINAYNDAIDPNRDINLDFGNAYKDALEIVNVKKSSFGNAVEVVGSMLNRFASSVSSVLTDENIEKVSQIAKDISNGNISAEAVVNAYAEHMKNEKTDEHKVITFGSNK